MKKHHEDLLWSLAMLLMSVWAYWLGDHIWALLVAFGSGFLLCASLTEWQRYYERRIADLKSSTGDPT